MKFNRNLNLKQTKFISAVKSQFDINQAQTPLSGRSKKSYHGNEFMGILRQKISSPNLIMRDAVLDVSQNSQQIPIFSFAGSGELESDGANNAFKEEQLKKELEIGIRQKKKKKVYSSLQEYYTQFYFPNEFRLKQQYFSNTKFHEKTDLFYKPFEEVIKDYLEVFATCFSDVPKCDIRVQIIQQKETTEYIYQQFLNYIKDDIEEEDFKKIRHNFEQIKKNHIHQPIKYFEKLNGYQEVQLLASKILTTIPKDIFQKEDYHTVKNNPQIMHFLIQIFRQNYDKAKFILDVFIQSNQAITYLDYSLIKFQTWKHFFLKDKQNVQQQQLEIKDVQLILQHIENFRIFMFQQNINAIKEQQDQIVQCLTKVKILKSDQYFGKFPIQLIQQFLEDFISTFMLNRQYQNILTFDDTLLNELKQAVLSCLPPNIENPYIQKKDIISKIYIFKLENNLIQDTDVAQDDIAAIVYLALNKNVKIQAILVTGSGEAYCDQGIENIEKMLNFINYEDIPVLCGDNYPLQGYFSFPKIVRDFANTDKFTFFTEQNQDQKQKQYKRQNIRKNQHAADFQVEFLNNQKEKNIDILVLGPITNLALSLQKDPQIVDKINKVVFMGGSLDVEGNLNLPNIHQSENKYAEWNVFSDSLAAKQVIENYNLDFYLISLDGTSQVPVTKDYIDQIHNLISEIIIKNQNQESLQFASFFTNLFRKQIYKYPQSKLDFWDVLAAQALIDPNVCQFQKEKVQREENDVERQFRVYNNWFEVLNRKSQREINNGQIFRSDKGALNNSVEIEAVFITGSGEAYCDQGINNIVKTLDFLNYKDIPIVCGQNYPIQGYLQFPQIIRDRANSDPFPFLPLSNKRNVIRNQSAIDFQIQFLQNLEQDEKINLLILGPMTNLALSLEKEPEIYKKLDQIYFMGGAVDAPGNLHIPGIYETENIFTEYNIFADSKSAQMVFANKNLKLKMIGLDGTNQLPITAEYLQNLLQKIEEKKKEFSNSLQLLNALKYGEFFVEIFYDWVRKYQKAELYFWDVLAATAIIHDDVCTYEEENLYVQVTEISKEEENELERKFRIDQNWFPYHNRTSLREIDNGRILKSQELGNPIKYCKNVDKKIFDEAIENSLLGLEYIIQLQEKIE
ncbi:Inosine/uridine-preferring nucleoside hydrolase domain [Pseudocohnilembus persalinus]|uniref:Inosine/uridine-preferring nucleoside hydrolase domain n=1 Tax=Pseudocohnilembus persalinus TaxID=266149 RepID=A0A0V0R685_PSEPJ|nr:Inosine/uridine-preferring nucleoside hydrolase domain [Pseudocohnilembus persalinus]|eukprot:KRX09872.1 Inosine/uridine-preferring nucleoside hydrolase domain [Pseudocohnilembus persalinus]